MVEEELEEAQLWKSLTKKCGALILSKDEWAEYESIQRGKEPSTDAVGAKEKKRAGRNHRSIWPEREKCQLMLSRVKIKELICNKEPEAP